MVKRALPATPGARATSGEVKGLRQEMRDLKELVAESFVWRTGFSKKNMIGAWGRRGMRYPASEKLEIIRLVEQSSPHLGVGSTLDELGIPKTTFYRWYDRFLAFGDAGLEDRNSMARWAGCGTGSPDDVRGQIIDGLPWRRRNIVAPGTGRQVYGHQGATLSRKPRFTGFSRPTT